MDASIGPMGCRGVTAIMRIWPVSAATAKAKRKSVVGAGRARILASSAGRLWAGWRSESWRFVRGLLFGDLVKNSSCCLAPWRDWASKLRDES